MSTYTQEKNHVIKFIREFQQKLQNCLEFINLLDFEVTQGTDGEQMVTTANISDGAILSEDFSKLGTVMNQMQLSFDTIM